MTDESGEGHIYEYEGPGADKILVRGEPPKDSHPSGLSMLKERKEEIEPIISDVKSQFEKAGIILLSEQETMDFVSYFGFASGLIERESTVALTCHIVPPESRIGERRYSAWVPQNKRVGRLSQADREQLLFDSGLIDSGLKGELASVRTTRNELVHGAWSSLKLTEEDSYLADVERAYRAEEKMIEIANDANLRSLKAAKEEANGR